MSKKVADIIVETLQSAGVKHCHGVVGGAGNWDSTLSEPCGVAWSRRRCLGNGEGEFSLVEALFA